MVADGRDCGTAVFPLAEYKFFIIASLAVRASRCQSKVRNGTESLTFEECKKIIAQRDERDSSRTLAPLKPADDAHIIDSSSMTVQDVINEITAVMESA